MTYKKLKSLLKISISINGVLFILVVGIAFMMSISGCTTNPTGPGSGGNVAEKPGDSPAPGDVAGLLAVVTAAKDVTGYSWNDRGRAPRAYIDGTTLTFARAYCQPKRSDVQVVSAKPTGASSDALVFLQSKFDAAGLKNVGGVDTLRHVYVLVMGLGMRESSGRHCCGRDTSSQTASNAEKASTVEAGAWQTSHDSIGASPELAKLFAKYRASSDGCLLEVFKKGVTCNATNWKNLGQGADGLAFQKLSKECPAFTAEYAAVMMRARRSHYGPINTKKVEILKTVDVMLKNVQAYIDQYPGVCEVL